MIPKRMFSLKKFFEQYDTKYVRSREAKDLITKSHLYELRPLLEETMWSPRIDPMAQNSDKISGYWKISDEGLMKLYELFPELQEEIDKHIARIAKKTLVM